MMTLKEGKRVPSASWGTLLAGDFFVSKEDLAFSNFACGSRRQPNLRLVAPVHATLFTDAVMVKKRETKRFVRNIDYFVYTFIFG